MRRLILIFVLLSGYALAQNSSGIQAGAALNNGSAIIPNGGCRFLNQTLPAGSNAALYMVNLLTADCVAPTTFSLSSGSFPGWATLNPLTGQISGIAATGTNTFILQVVDGEGITALSTQLVISITGPSGSWPAPLDAFTSSGCTSQACEPHGTNTLCVGTPVSATALPGGACASSFAATTAGLQAALNSLPAAPCGTVVNIKNIVGYTQFTIPSGIACGPPNNALWDWITGDLSDTIPPEGQRVTPCWIGIPQSAMPYYLFSTGDALCSAPARHMPRIMAGALNGAPPIALAIPSNSNVAPTGIRIQLVETTRDSTADIGTNGGVDLSYNPGISVQTAGLPCSLNPLTGGRNALPVNALACYNVQPSYITVSQIVAHGDAQRQTVRGFEFAGSRQTVLQDSYLYDFNTTYAGGSGDSQAIHGGGGHGYSGQGDWVIKNDFLASSTQGVGLFCGNYAEPITPTTLKDGVPTYVRWTQLMSEKNAFWNPERGLSLNDTENIEGLSVSPAPSDQELVVNAPLQLQQGQIFQLQTLILNDTGGGLNRMSDAGGLGSVTVDGVAYTTPNSANGVITKNGEHSAGSAPYLSQNQISWTYNVCSGAGVPIAACTGATTAGSHVIAFTYNAIDVRQGSNFGGTRPLTKSVTISVLSGAPTHQIVLSPDPGHSPDLELQPSYSDGFGNSRTFSGIFQQEANFTPGALTWKVDGITNGNSTTGTINASLSGLPSGAALYTSPATTGTHTITVTDGTTTSNSVTITISNQATILGYDFKPVTSKNLFELKCINIGQADNSLFELAYGSNGNGGGQGGLWFLMQTINQGFPTNGQTQDGSGNNTNNIGPEHGNDFFGFNLHFLHSCCAAAIDPLAGQSLGERNILLSNIEVEDANPYKWTNGWLKNQFNVFAQITGSPSGTLVPWSSASFPTLFNVAFNHITYVGGTSTLGNGSLMSLANNTAQFPMTGFTITNSIIMAPGSTTFNDNNGESPPCNTASGTGANNTEARALAGSGSAKPCWSPGYVFSPNAFVDSAAAASVFTSAPIYQPLDSDTTLFPNYNGGNGGNYCPPNGSQYAAGGARQANDGLAMGMNCLAILTSDEAARSGTRYTTLATQTANNTSACSTSIFPSYCTVALPDFQTNAANTGAQTVHLTPIGHVSQMPIQSYLYPGATTRVIMAYQPWFPGQASCWTLPFAGSSAHPCVGYNENSSSVVAKQHQTMLNEGVTDVSPDWYGNSSGQSFINTTVATQAADLLARCTSTTSASCPLHLMVMVDGGLITSGMSGVSGCPQGATDQTTCITTVLNAAYDYINAQWGRQIYYSTDPVSGQPMTLTFITKGSWSGSNWSTIWTNVKTHMAGYATPYKVIEEYGNFSDTAIDGQYGWPQSEAYSAAAQLCWKGASCSFDYINDLYTKAQSNPSKILIGHIFPGFDGSNNNYNNDVTARRCGQTLYDLTQKIWVTGTGFTLYSASNPLNWLLVPTWNDYGEGTNVEDGVDNCYTLSSSLTGNVLSWTLNPSDATYASTSTIDHFTIWYQDSNSNLYRALDFIPVTTLSQDLSTLIPSGTNTVYLEMVGKPLILNRMAAGVSYTH